MLPIIRGSGTLGAASKRSPFLFAGIVLVAGGMITLIAPRAIGMAAGLMQLWPLFLILAGLLRIAGFVIERRPRAPLGAAFLVAAGILLLVAQNTESNLLEVYGKYWILVLAVYSSAELLRFYSHRSGDGPEPRLFSLPKLLAVMLIASTGVLSSRFAARTSSLLSILRVPGSVSGVSDSVSRAYNFEDPATVTDDYRGSTATVNNANGDVSIVGGAPVLRVSLTKTVKATSEREARSLADQIRLSVEKTAAGIQIGTNRGQVGGDFRTNLKIELPRGLAIGVTNNNGGVASSRADGPLSITAAGGPVTVAQIAGSVRITIDGSAGIDASNVAGNLSIAGAKDVKVVNVGGRLDLAASNGFVELRDVKGPVRLDASSCTIKAANMTENCQIQSGHSTVEVFRASNVVIDGPGSNIKAQQVSGDLKITSSDGSVRLQSIEGSVAVSASHSSVIIDGLRGDAKVQASYAPITVRNFRGGASIETSHDRVVIAASDPVADIQVKNSYGDIKMTLPRSGGFQLKAQAQHGSIRCPASYGHATMDEPGPVANMSFGDHGPRIVLTAEQGDIMLEQSAPRAGRIE